jgi:hypothetical protein
MLRLVGAGLAITWRAGRRELITMTNYVTIAADPGRHPRTSPHYDPRSERRKRKRQAPRRCLRDEEAAGSNPATPTQVTGQIRSLELACGGPKHDYDGPKHD